jgi:hypothetical protein
LCHHFRGDREAFALDGSCACGHNRLAHKPVTFCRGSYACTCSAGRYEAFCFDEDGCCKDASCEHPRSRHHDELPAIWEELDKKLPASHAAARMMENAYAHENAESDSDTDTLNSGINSVAL